MVEIHFKNRTLFWMMLITSCLLSVPPSWIFVGKLSHYYRSFKDPRTSTLKPSKSSRTPHAKDHKLDDSFDIHFVEFSLSAPMAKKVYLAADFNRWKTKSIQLEKDEAGVWKILLPLPEGVYSYAFGVDGAWILDPKAKKTTQSQGRTVSVLMVP